jgi:hypothetical protein
LVVEFVVERFVLPFMLVFPVLIGVDVDIGVAFTTIAVLALAFRVLALVLTFTAVSPHAEKPATASESAIKDPIFFIVVSSVISRFELARTLKVARFRVQAGRHLISGLSSSQSAPRRVRILSMRVGWECIRENTSRE